MAVIGPFGFTGGFNSKAYAPTLPANHMPDGQDAQVYYMSLQKRSGSQILNSSPLNSSAILTGLYDWLSAGTRFQLAVAGNKIFTQSALSGTFTDRTGGATITAGRSNLHTFSSLNGLAIICGGTTPDTVLKWSGSGNVASLGGTPPVGNITVTANNFVFISGVTATPSRVFWSNPGDPETWPVTQYVDFRSNDGDIVTALCDFGQNLLISKKRSAGILFTQTNTVSGAVTLAPLTQIPCYAGIGGPLAWDHLPNGQIVFLGSNGHAYIFDGSNFNDISDQPAPAPSIQPTFDAMNFSQIPLAVVQCYPTRNQVWFSITSGTGTTNNQILVYDYQLDIWEPPFSNINANVMEACIDTRSVPSHAVVMVTGNYSGSVIEQDHGNTNAEATNSVIDGYGTCSIVLGKELVDFIPRSLIILYESQSAASVLNVNYGFNGLKELGQSYVLPMQQVGGLLDSTFFLDLSVLGGVALQRAIVPLINSDRVFSIQVQFRNQLGGQPFTVHPFWVSDEVVT